MKLAIWSIGKIGKNLIGHNLRDALEINTPRRKATLYHLRIKIMFKFDFNLINYNMNLFTYTENYDL